ncbi:MAG: type II toxin-antitoxin system HicA family toxin [Nitrospinae bacterium]|nr:type II toxin-antitoxin system HicA family toxin [Nitrospinota bacterium]
MGDIIPIETNRNKIKRRLESDGWYLSRHGSNHDIYRHPRKSGTITLPRHRTLTPGVVRTIAARAGWTD